MPEDQEINGSPDGDALVEPAPFSPTQVPPDPPDIPVDSTEIRHTYSSFFCGPLPSPISLNEYEKICPGTAKIIIDAFKDQSNHRRTMERYDGTTTRIGMVFAFILGLSAIAAGVIMGSLYGAGVIVTALAALVGAFIRGSKLIKENEDEGSDRGKQMHLPFPPDQN
jgi:uncharacterized membrane protein